VPLQTAEREERELVSFELIALPLALKAPARLA